MSVTSAPTSARFRAAVTVRPTDAADVFVATTQDVPWPKSYGGDLLAQATAAATQTVAGDRRLHSMHSLFVAPAPIGAEVRYEVDRLRDGRSYSSRHVRGHVGETVVCEGLFSFHVGEESATLAPSASEVPPADAVPSTADRVAGVDGAAAAYWAHDRSFDLRHIDGSPYIAPAPADNGEVRLWVRSFEALADDPQLHRLALVYVCDYAMLEPILASQGWAWTEPGLVTASLDHAMWLHADARLDEWVQCTLTAVSLSEGRGLVRGEFHTADGRHIASVAQQGMIRRITPPTV